MNRRHLLALTAGGMAAQVLPLDEHTRHIWPIHEVDGDTSDYVEDDDRRQYAVRRERDLGINTPEMHASDPAVREKAVEAKAFRRQWFEQHLACNTDTDHWPRIDGTLFSEYVSVPYFLLKSEKSDSFDRWLSLIYCQAGHNLEQALLDAGLAVTYYP